MSYTEGVLNTVGRSARLDGCLVLAMVCGTVSCGGEVVELASGSSGPASQDPCGSPACTVGECEVEEISDATGLGGVVHGPVITSRYVYWVHEENVGDPAWGWTLFRVPRCGGGPTVVDEASGAFGDLVTRGESLFYLAYNGEEAPGGALRVVADGAALATTIIDGVGAPQNLTADDDALFWTAQGPPPQILSVSPNGSQPHVVVADTTFWLGLAVDATDVYWGSEGFVARASKAGGPPTELASVTYGGNMLVDDTAAYVVDLMSGDTNRILRLSKNGGTPSELGSGVIWPFLAQHGDAIYYRDLDTLWQQPKSGETPQPIARTRFFSELGGDDQALYWYDDGIKRLVFGDSD